MLRRSGFTLIEVLVTIAIIAILVAIALPNYSAYVTRSKITEATSNLLAMRTKMEQYFQDNRTYAGACVAGTVAALPVGLKFFDITCPPANLTATTYTVQAAGKAGTDLASMTLTIDQGNVRKTVSVPADWTLPSTNCWALKKNGDC
jgi:type IV pilus assembly protein PilE